VARDRFLDDPWPRLCWVAPLALILTTVSQMGFLYLMERPPASTPVPRPIDVQVIELPAAIRKPEPPPVRKTERPRPPRPTPAPPKPKLEVLPSPPPPPPSPTPAPPPEPVRQPAPEPQRTAPAPAPAPAAVAAPVVTAPPTPAAPARPSAAVPVEPPVRAPSAAAVPPPPPVPGTPGGTGFGGGKGGARAIYKPLPEIPEALRHQKIDVVAVARFRVAANGSAQVELIEPTADPELNRALLDALHRWRFFPGMENGKPAPSTVDVRIPISVR
jgi:protein TonB